MEKILDELLILKNENYKKFQSSLIPTQDKDLVLGIKTPALRAYAKKISGTETAKTFMNELPHKYFEENQLHAFLISNIKDFDKCIDELNKFLPFVDNWATCDQMTPKILKKQPDILINIIKTWLKSSHTYTIRFGIKQLMDHYLDSEFKEEYLELVCSVDSDQYYVKMMAAWYFATALAKQYDSTIPYLENKRLPEWTHKKAIQKAVESFRVTDEHKIYLKTLR